MSTMQAMGIKAVDLESLVVLLNEPSIVYDFSQRKGFIQWKNSYRVILRQNSNGRDCHVRVYLPGMETLMEGETLSVRARGDVHFTDMKYYRDSRCFSAKVIGRNQGELQFESIVLSDPLRSFRKKGR